MSVNASKRHAGIVTIPRYPVAEGAPYASAVALRARYRLVAEKLAARITSGAIPVNAKMPGKRGIALEEGVSVQTVEKSLRLLESWGLVEAAQGVGVFVVSRELKQTPSADERLAALEADVAAIKKHLGMTGDR